MKLARTLAVVAGAATVLAFAPFGLAPVAIATFAVLFWLLLTSPTARAAALRGFLFGMGLFLAGVSWVYVSLHVFGMMPAALAVIATVGFCAYLSLFPALVGWLAWHVRGGPITAPLLVMPGLWTISEWLRGWLFTGFPWLSAGYAQIDTPLAGIAPIAGVFGMSFATTMTAGAVVAIAAATRRMRIALVGGIVALHVGSALLGTIAWTTAKDRPVSVALLQGNVPQDLKFVPGRYEAIVDGYARQVEGTRARLVVLPETAIPRFLDQIEPDWIERVRDHVARVDGDLLLGVPTGDLRGAYFNSVVSLGASPLQTYSKLHLVPFGEFVPPGFGWVVNVLRIPLSDFARGRPDQRPLAVAGERVAVNICYEDAFGEEIAAQLPEATLLVNVSNVAWFGDSLAPAQHLEISRMRARETGRPMLRATNTGVTAVIDPRGRTVQALPTFTEGVLETEVVGYTGATPYVRWGDAPAFFGSLAAIAIGALLARRRRIA